MRKADNHAIETLFKEMRDEDDDPVGFNHVDARHHNADQPGDCR
jgi:hypothetical protein